MIAPTFIVFAMVFAVVVYLWREDRSDARYWEAEAMDAFSRLDDLVLAVANDRERRRCVEKSVPFVRIPDDRVIAVESNGRRHVVNGRDPVFPTHGIVGQSDDP